MTRFAKSSSPAYHRCRKPGPGDLGCSVAQGDKTEAGFMPEARPRKCGGWAAHPGPVGGQPLASRGAQILASAEDFMVPQG